jgi:hypothetical protein
MVVRCVALGEGIHNLGATIVERRYFCGLIGVPLFRLALRDRTCFPNRACKESPPQAEQFLIVAEARP